MSYSIETMRGKRTKSGRSTKSLAEVMGEQGVQPKHPDPSREYLGEVMKGGGARKAGSKGSEHKYLGNAMGQTSKK